MKKQILAPSILALFVASAAHAGTTFDTAAGSLYLGGDVEFDYTSSRGTNLDSSGRISIDIHGQRVLDNGAFAAFKANPLYNLDKKTYIDDVYFQFGVQNDWNLKVGSFEASDLSSAGQDTYVADDTGVYFYRASEARGRTTGSANGQATFTKSMDNTSFELTAQSQNSGDTVVLRPVVSYAADSLSLSIGAELPVVDGNDNQDWVGFGATTNISVSETVTLNFRAALKTGDDTSTGEDQMTAGAGIQVSNFYAAVLHGDDGVANATTTYASYKIPAVMGLDNFDVYLGAGYTFAEDSDNDQYGARVRLKYNF